MPNLKSIQHAFDLLSNPETAYKKSYQALNYQFRKKYSVEIERQVESIYNATKHTLGKNANINKFKSSLRRSITSQYKNTKMQNDYATFSRRFVLLKEYKVAGNTSKLLNTLSELSFSGKKERYIENIKSAISQTSYLSDNDKRKLWRKIDSLSAKKLKLYERFFDQILAHYHDDNLQEELTEMFEQILQI